MENDFYTPTAMTPTMELRWKPIWTGRRYEDKLQQKHISNDGNIIEWKVIETVFDDAPDIESKLGA